MTGYKYLGDFSATPPWHSITLSCDDCRVTWTGCFDANQCPKCGSSEGYEQRNKALEVLNPDPKARLVENYKKLKELHVQLRGILKELEDRVS